MKYLEDLSNLKSHNYRNLSEESVKALMESVLAVGVQEPVHVFEATDTQERYILSGHHRVEAVRRLQTQSPHLMVKLPARVTKGKKAELDEKKNLVPRLLSNLLRTDLNAVERGEACLQLKNAGESVDGIAKILGSSKRTVDRLLDVAALPKEAKEYIAENNVTDGKAYRAAAKFKRGGSDMPDLFMQTSKHICP